MAATYVTVAQLRSVLGVGTLYSDADLESACQTAQDILNQYLWFNSISSNRINNSKWRRYCRAICTS